jgi:DNA-binding response OmpR family regulator
MSDRFFILVADRNRHVREFLHRELSAAGYRVEVAGDGREVLDILLRDHPPDLLILDLELPYPGGVHLLEELQARERLVPVVIHTFPTDAANHPAVQQVAAFVEKSGNTDHLKAVVEEVLERSYPHRPHAPRGDPSRLPAEARSGAGVAAAGEE